MMFVQVMDAADVGRGFQTWNTKDSPSVTGKCRKIMRLNNNRCVEDGE